MKRCYCGNDNLSEYSRQYSKCDVCKTLVSKYDFFEDIYDVKKEDEDLYGKNYWEDIMVKEAGVKDIDELIDMYIPERAAYWLKNVLKYIKLGAKIAEVGCGLGQFSYLLKQTGFPQTAFELSPQICECIREKLGLQVVCGELCSADDKYQAILVIDVFEHLTEPEKFILDCKNRLEDKGLLVLQTPCYDPQFTYEEMRQYKPRFEHLLVEKQHVYLYSRESITAILKKHGFEYIVFEPAFFGNDYDMFLFASRKPIQENSAEEIDKYLNSIPDGRLIKALIRLYEEKEQKELERQAIDKERNKMLVDINSLTELVNQKQKAVDEFEYASEQRLSAIEKLTADNQQLKQAAEDRLADIEKLTADNQILKQAAEERLQIINKLSRENEELNKAAQERLAIIEQLTKE